MNTNQTSSPAGVFMSGHEPVNTPRTHAAVNGAVNTPGRTVHDVHPRPGNVHGTVHRETRLPASASAESVDPRAGQIRSAEKALSVGTWLIVFGAMLYSVLTVTPLMAEHTPDGWKWTAPILPLVVDAAVVIVVRLDSVLARLGGKGGCWPVVLRWMTGLMTLALNTADSALSRDAVGGAVHAVAPLLLIVTAETGLAYRRAIHCALAAEQDRQQAEHAAQRKAERERVLAVERQAREEREARERQVREQREHEAELARQEREHRERLAREDREAQERQFEQARAERERREREQHQARAERERQQREREHRAAQTAQAEREAERERAEQTQRRRAKLMATPAPADKLPEHEALTVVREAFEAGLSVRAAVSRCGWSIGWVNNRYQELRGQGDGDTDSQPAEPEPAST